MMRVSFVLVLVALVGLSAGFNLSQFSSRLGKVSYAKASVAGVKAHQKEIEALPKDQQKLLDDCLESAALNAADMDSSLAEFFSEVGGCVNVEGKVSAAVPALIKKMSASAQKG